MQNSFEYDVFLSFASEDQEAVKSIWQELIHNNLRVFWSDEDLRKSIGQSFFSVIQDALLHSNHFLLICSPNSINSNWVREEYETFFSQAYLPSDKKRRLFLYNLPNIERSILPPLLKNIHLSNSLEDIVSALGGVNVQSLDDKKAKIENPIDHHNSAIMQIKKENEALKDRIKELQLKQPKTPATSNIDYNVTLSEIKFIPKGTKFKADSNGFLESFDSWNTSWVEFVMKKEGLRHLTEDHIKIIAFIRDYYKKNGIAPMVRDLSNNTGMKLKHIRELFPSGPSRGAFKMAGLPSISIPNLIFQRDR